MPVACTVHDLVTLGARVLHGAVEKVVVEPRNQAGTRVMCSGCSGYFEDDEGREQGDNLSDEQVEALGLFETNGNRPWEEQFGRAMKTGQGVEEYEVLVSAERIIERRTIRANGFFISGEEPVDVMGTWKRSLRGYERLGTASAKHYQTQDLVGPPPCDGDSASCRCFIWWLLAGATLGVLTIWLATR